MVGTLVLFFCLILSITFPVTANTAPHFGAGLVAVLLIAGLATFGAVTASRGAFAAVSGSDLAAHRA